MGGLCLQVHAEGYLEALEGLCFLEIYFDAFQERHVAADPAELELSGFPKAAIFDVTYHKDAKIRNLLELCDNFFEFTEMLDDGVGAGRCQSFLAGVSVRDAAGVGVGAEAHLDIHGHVSDDEGLIGLEGELVEGHQHGIRVRLGARDIIGPQYQVEILRDAHVPEEGVERRGVAGRGDGEGVALLVQARERLLYFREEGRDNLDLEPVEYFAVGLDPGGNLLRGDAGNQGEDTGLQRNADGGAFLAPADAGARAQSK